MNTKKSVSFADQLTKVYILPSKKSIKRQILSCSESESEKDPIPVNTNHSSNSLPITNGSKWSVRNFLPYIVSSEPESQNSIDQLTTTIPTKSVLVSKVNPLIEKEQANIKSSVILNLRNVELEAWEKDIQELAKTTPELAVSIEDSSIQLIESTLQSNLLQTEYVSSELSLSQLNESSLPTDNFYNNLPKSKNSQKKKKRSKKNKKISLIEEYEN